MGYQTDYSIKLTLMIGGKPATLTDDSPLLEVIKQLRESNEDAGFALDDDGSTSGEESKWYEHEEHMRTFSKQHPGILFELHGEGSENGDLWKKYFFDGKCQEAKAEIQIAPFDPKKLK